MFGFRGLGFLGLRGFRALEFFGLRGFRGLRLLKVQGFLGLSGFQGSVFGVKALHRGQQLCASNVTILHELTPRSLNPKPRMIAVIQQHVNPYTLEALN